VNDKSDERVDGAKHKLEQHEADQDWLRRASKRGSSKARVETECRVECAVMNENGEDDKSEEKLGLRDEKEFGRVSWLSAKSGGLGKLTYCSTSVRARGLALAVLIMKQEAAHPTPPRLQRGSSSRSTYRK